MIWSSIALLFAFGLLGIAAVGVVRKSYLKRAAKSAADDARAAISAERGDSEKSAKAADGEAELNPWDPENIPPWLHDALARIEEAHANGKKLPIQGDESETKDLAADATSSSSSISRERVGGEERPVEGEKSTGRNGSNRGDQDSMLKPVEWIVGNHQRPDAEAGSGAAQTVPVDAANGVPSRLSRLRGIVSASELKELEEVRNGAAETNDAENSANGRSRGTEQMASGNGAAHTNGSRLNALRRLAVAEKLKGLHRARYRVPLARDAAKEEKPAEPETAKSAAHSAELSGFPEPKPDSSLTGPGAVREQLDNSLTSEENEVTSVQPQPTKRPLRYLSVEDVQILPSRRGQYRKKE